MANTARKTATSSPARARPLSPAFHAPPMQPLELIELDPMLLDDPDQSFLKSVIEALGKKDMAEAIRLTQARADQHGKNSHLLNLLAGFLLQAGDIAAGEKTLQRAQKFAPNDVRILNNLACAQIRRGAYAGAQVILKNLLRSHPDIYVEAEYNLALSLFNEGKYAESWAITRKLLNDRPVQEVYILAIRLCNVVADVKTGTDLATKGLNTFNHAPIFSYYLAGALLSQDRWAEASLVAMGALNAQPENPYFALLYTNIMSIMRFSQYTPDHARAVCHALNSGAVNTTNLSQGWCSLVRNMPVWGALFDIAETITPDIAESQILKLDAARLLDDPLIISGMRRALLRNYEVEKVFTAIRYAFLIRIDRGDEISDSMRRLMSVMALQNHYNEFSFHTDAVEETKIADLRKRGGDDALLCLCLYGPLTKWMAREDIDALRQNPLLQDLVRVQVDEREDDLARMEKIPALTSIEDDVSRAVEEMYIENPYPAWLSANFSGDLSPLRLAAKPDDRIQVLLAGCGTGQHAVTTALLHENIQVTAIDLSRRSLAYAQRKTEAMGVPNLTYAQADILKLGSLNKKFDCIESVGVLHHMRVPEDGLAVLVGLLKPGGMFAIGLYSERARAAMTAGRDFVAAEKLESTPEGIRAFRHFVMEAPADHPLKPLTKNSDFYTISTCRDLVFHVQEHRYTLPQIRDMLDRHGLRFVRFIQSPPTMIAFRERYPAPGAEQDLRLWDQFEQDFPETFIGMYQFWAQKAD